MAPASLSGHFRPPGAPRTARCDTWEYYRFETADEDEDVVGFAVDGGIDSGEATLCSTGETIEVIDGL